MNQAKTQTENSHFVTALARGLEILRCFDRPRIELTVSEIARRTGLSQPTTWRLCKTLLDCGYLVRSTSGAGLRVGAPALTLGFAAIRGTSEVDLVRPYMRQLTRKTGGTTTLGAREGLEMISLEQIEGVHVRPNEPVGWRAGLASVASGLAVLAALPVNVRDDLCSRLSADKPAWQRRQPRVSNALNQFEQHGYVVLEHVIHGAFTAISVPLFEPGTNPDQQWALTLGAVSALWTDDSIANIGAELRKVAGLLQPALTALSTANPAPR